MGALLLGASQKPLSWRGASERRAGVFSARQQVRLHQRRVSRALVGLGASSVILLRTRAGNAAWQEEVWFPWAKRYEAVGLRQNPGVCCVPTLLGGEGWLTACLAVAGQERRSASLGELSLMSNREAASWGEEERWVLGERWWLQADGTGSRRGGRMVELALEQRLWGPSWCCLAGGSHKPAQLAPGVVLGTWASLSDAAPADQSVWIFEFSERTVLFTLFSPSTCPVVTQPSPFAPQTHPPAPMLCRGEAFLQPSDVAAGTAVAKGHGEPRVPCEKPDVIFPAGALCLEPAPGRSGAGEAVALRGDSLSRAWLARWEGKRLCVERFAAWS